MGARKKYNEKTVMISFRCPESKVEEIKKMVNEKLRTWQCGIAKIRLLPGDQHFLANRKYTIKKIGKKAHICRTVESSRGKFNVLLAQDILGINCEILFIDGNTLNNERENIRPINREVEFIY